MAMLPQNTLALARERAGGVSTEERWLERDGQKIYVSLAYTQRAQQALADARTVIVEGAGHGFYGEDRERVEGEAAAFVQKIVSESRQDMRAAA